MARAVVDKRIIAERAYELACERGLAGVDVRGIAEACGVSVGTIYNHYPAKDDLIVEVVATFWRHAFPVELCRLEEGERFDGYVMRLHDAMRTALESFRSDWLPAAAALSARGERERHEREDAAFSHIEAGLLRVLNMDERADCSRLGIDARELASLVRRELVSVLCEGGSCRALAALLGAALYGEAFGERRGDACSK